MATVDVLIPAYNAAKYLPTAIESVISQTFEDWQILLVDDGSTDTTSEIAAHYGERLGARFRYIRQQNRGLPAARNAAIRSGSSEFLALLDADDVWLPNRLSESLRSFHNRPQVGLAYGLITQIDPQGRLLQTFKGNRSWAEGKIAPYIYMRKVELPCPTLTFRRQAAEQVGLFDETMRATEDRDLCLRIALQYEVAFVPEVIAYYRISPQSMSTDPDRMLKAQLSFIRKHYGSPGCSAWVRQVALARVYKQYAEALKSRRRTWPALVSSMRALAMWPFEADNARTAGSLLFDWIGTRAGSRT